jgi:hypothetical protein
MTRAWSLLRGSPQVRQRQLVLSFWSRDLREASQRCVSTNASGGPLTVSPTCTRTPKGGPGMLSCALAAAILTSSPRSVWSLPKLQARTYQNLWLRTRRACCEEDCHQAWLPCHLWKSCFEGVSSGQPSTSRSTVLKDSYELVMQLRRGTAQKGRTLIERDAQAVAAKEGCRFEEGNHSPRI